MGLKNLKGLYTKGKGEQKNSQSQKESNHLKKLEINQLKELISSKLNDPEMAKKAAQIISEMINNPHKK